MKCFVKHGTFRVWLEVVLSVAPRCGQNLQTLLLDEEHFLVLLNHLSETNVNYV